MAQIQNSSPYKLVYCCCFRFLSSQSSQSQSWQRRACGTSVPACVWTDGSCWAHPAVKPAATSVEFPLFFWHNKVKVIESSAIFGDPFDWWYLLVIIIRRRPGTPIAFDWWLVIVFLLLLFIVGVDLARLQGLALGQQFCCSPETGNISATNRHTQQTWSPDLILPTCFVLLLFTFGLQFFHGLGFFVKFFVPFGPSLLVVWHHLEEDGDFNHEEKQKRKSATHSSMKQNSPLVCLEPETASFFLVLLPASFSSPLSPSSLPSSASSWSRTCEDQKYVDVSSFLIQLQLRKKNVSFCIYSTNARPVPSPLTVSLAPLSSQFCWRALALSPSLSSAPVELYLQHLPSGRRHSRPWKRRLQRSLSLSWRTNCCSQNRTPHLIEELQGYRLAVLHHIWYGTDRIWELKVNVTLWGVLYL